MLARLLELNRQRAEEERLAGGAVPESAGREAEQGEDATGMLGAAGKVKQGGKAKGAARPRGSRAKPELGPGLFDKKPSK